MAMNTTFTRPISPLGRKTDGEGGLRPDGDEVVVVVVLDLIENCHFGTQTVVI